MAGEGGTRRWGGAQRATAAWLMLSALAGIVALAWTQAGIYAVYFTLAGIDMLAPFKAREPALWVGLAVALLTAGLLTYATGVRRPLGRSGGWRLGAAATLVGGGCMAVAYVGRHIHFRSVDARPSANLHAPILSDHVGYPGAVNVSSPYLWLGLGGGLLCFGAWTLLAVGPPAGRMGAGRRAFTWLAVGCAAWCLIAGAWEVAVAVGGSSCGGLSCGALADFEFRARPWGAMASVAAALTCATLLLRRRDRRLATG